MMVGIRIHPVLLVLLLESAFGDGMAVLAVRIRGMVLPSALEQRYV